MYDEAAAMSRESGVFEILDVTFRTKVLYVISLT